MQLATIVSYCSQERPYIGDVVRNAVKFSDAVVVSIGTRLYSGPPEDTASLFELDVLGAVSDPADRAKLHLATYEVPSAIPADQHTSHFHNLARLAGFQRARSVLGATHPRFWVLFLDADEVAEGDRFRAWLSAPANAERLRSDTTTMYKFANYWAFIHPQLVSTEHEDSVFMVHSSMLNQEALMHPRERDGIYLWHWSKGDAAGGRIDRARVERSVGNERPMFWHYSWVRGARQGAHSSHMSDAERASDDAERASDDADLQAREAGLRAKVDGWGHRGDRNWGAVISATFERIRSTRAWPTRDFVHNHPLVWVDAPH